MYSYTHYALQQIQSAPASEKKTKATKITCKVGRDESVAPFLYFDFCLKLPHLTVSSRSADSIALRPTVSICHCDFFYLRYICNAAYYSHDSSFTDGRRMIETRDVHGSDRIQSDPIRPDPTNPTIRSDYPKLQMIFMYGPVQHPGLRETSKIRKSRKPINLPID